MVGCCALASAEAIAHNRRALYDLARYFNYS
jgi:hypothetical protein